LNQYIYYLKISDEGTCVSKPCNEGTCHTKDGVYWCDCPPNSNGYECGSIKQDSKDDDNKWGHDQGIKHTHITRTNYQIIC
jgi:hypothetical protein